MFLKEHPFEIRQEDKVPELAIGRWPCFGLRQDPETRLVSSTF